MDVLRTQNFGLTQFPFTDDPLQSQCAACRLDTWPSNRTHRRLRPGGRIASCVRRRDHGREDDQGQPPERAAERNRWLGM